MARKFFDSDLIKTNLKSGLTVSLVSMPLSIPLAVASGVSPTTGLITAIWAALIASLFGGSNYNIVGVTGALSGVIASYALINGPAAVATLAIVSGILIFLAYLIKLEKYLFFVPSSVIHGFTLGIALILILNQFNFALGLQNLPKHEKFIENVFESFSHIADFSGITFLIFSAFFVALIILRIILPNVPGALVMSPIGIFLGYLTNNKLVSISIETLGDKFGEIKPVLFDIKSIIITKTLFTTAVVVAIIAILETLLSAKIADAATKTKFNVRREMFGLSLANIVSGLFGGIPATAALARTSFNIKSGATDKISATFCSLFMAAGAFLFLSYFRYIPMAVIAAILVNVAVGMIGREHFERLYLHDKTNFIISLLVAFLTIYEDPILGILSGTVIALLALSNQIATSFYETKIHENILQDNIQEDSTGSVKLAGKKKNILEYTIKGELVYLNAQGHILRFESDFSEYSGVILILSDIFYIDLDGIDAIDEIIEIIEKKKQKVAVVSNNLYIKNMLQASRKFEKLESKKLVFNTTGDAVKYLEKDI